MNAGRLLGLVGQNINRSRKNFIMSGIGIVVGVATFVFFMGLSEGIKEVVLGRIFLIEQVEVIKKTFDTGIIQTDSLMGFGGSKALNDDVVADLRGLEGVEAVYPKMKFTFPTRGWGGKEVFGRNLWAEIIADGIDPELVKSDLEDPSVFRDYEVEIACEVSADNPQSTCPVGRTCVEQRCQKIACDPEQEKESRRCTGESYCAEDTKQCEVPIPVLVSNHLLELYNGSLATAMSSGKRKMPRLSPNALKGFTLNVSFGKSFLGKSKRSKPITRRIKLVGFSDRAISVGVTLPIDYVRRLNAKFTDSKAGREYHSILVKVKDQTRVPAITAAVRDRGFEIADKTENAERAADIIRTVEGVFGLVSVVIIGIAAINISQMFFMIIYQRKREIGLLRALGASRGDIRGIILTEAAAIGLAAGAIGAGVGYGASRLADFVAARLPKFPYKPETFFDFPAWVWLAALAGAVLFCLIGAFFPARTAARQEPAAALTE